MMHPVVILILISLVILVDRANSQGPVANFPVNDCNVSKQCIGSPDVGCLQTGICRELLKYSYDSADPEKIKIELFGAPPMPGASNFWVALGVNSQPQMAGTLVSECVYNGGDGTVNVFASFNADQGYSNRRLAQEKYGISDDTGTYNNGILDCKFTLDRVRTAQGHTYNLSTPLYLLLGDGPAQGLVLKPHTSDPWSSSQPYTLAVANNAPRGVFTNLQSLNTIAPVPVNADSQSAASGIKSTRNKAAPASITGCGQSKGCLAVPANCLSAGGSCTSVVSYSVNPDKTGELLIELWRTMPTQDDQYVAMGVNPTAQTMSGTGVIACIDHTDKIEVIPALNRGYSPIATTNPADGITVIETAADGGHLYCKFSVQTKKSFQTSAETMNADLNNPAYLMLASGPARAGGLGKHTVVPIISTEKIAFTSVGIAGAGANKDLYKAHGGLMVGAWMFLASIGIFTARYYKKMWLSHKPCGLPLWFHIHRPVMLTVVSLAIAGFVIIFVQKAGLWTTTAPSENPHPIIGIIAFILGLIQPIMAAFRPHPGTANRPIFNWAHFLVGFSAHIMAIAAIFLGLRMPQMSVDGASLWIMVAFSAFHALWLILMQFIEWFAPKAQQKTTTVQMKTVNGNGTVFEETVHQEPVETSPASTLKTILWFTHVVVVGGLTIAILVLIGISP